jgi:hypothetical protein
MILATVRSANGLRAVRIRRKRDQETTQGPDSHTIAMIAGTSRKAFRRLVQAPLKPLPVNELDFSLTAHT